MKKYIILAIGLFVGTAQAQEAIPAYLKDSVITVTLKNGKVYKFDGNEYKVVRRGSKAAPVAETKQEEAQPVVIVNRAAPERRKNRVSLLGGVGFDGLDTTNSGNSVEVKQNKSGVFGLSYSRSLDEKFSISVQGLSNETYTLGAGYDF